MKQRRQQALRKKPSKSLQEHTFSQMFQVGVNSAGERICAHRHLEAGTCRDAKDSRRGGSSEKKEKKNKKKSVVVEQAAVREPERDSLVEPGLRQLLDAMDAAACWCRGMLGRLRKLQRSTKASITDLLEEAARVPQEVMN